MPKIFSKKYYFLQKILFSVFSTFSYFFIRHFLFCIISTNYVEPKDLAKLLQKLTAIYNVFLAFRLYFDLGILIFESKS